MRRLRATAIAAVFALAAPASALAQSAGDDQYRDPFAGEDQGRQEAAGGGSGGGGGSGQAAAPAPPTASAPVAQPASSAPATTLPYTGLPALAMTGIGALMLAAGVGLRRSSR